MLPRLPETWRSVASHRSCFDPCHTDACFVEFQCCANIRLENGDELLAVFVDVGHGRGCITQRVSQYRVVRSAKIGQRTEVCSGTHRA
jgi:hypothetical protein